ncbi:MAG: hypothetical protein ACP5NF_05630 [Thermoanaerobaculum sp.]
MVVAWLLSLGLAGAMELRLELPPQVAVDPLRPEELAPAVAVPWEGGEAPWVPVVERRLPSAFRVWVPKGASLAAFDVEARVLGSGLRAEGQPSRIPAKVRVEGLRLVARNPDGDLWEGDLVLSLDVSRALAGSFSGTLQVTLSGR